MVGIDLQYVIGRCLIEFTAEIPIGVAGHVNRAGLIARGSDFKPNTVIRDQCVGCRCLERARISLIAGGRGQRKTDTGFGLIRNRP